MMRVFCLGLASLCLLAACASKGPPVGGFSAMGVPQTDVAPAVAPEYRIGPLDKLAISVFQSPDLSQPSVQVDTSGQILLPMIGVVMASGKTNTELAGEITAKLADCCLRNPNVAVLVTEAVSQQVTVAGAVTRSGVYILRGRTSLLQAVSMAGGPDESTANTKRVAVYRTVGGQRMGASFDLNAIRTGNAEDPQIYGGDTIIVDTSDAKSTWHSVVTAVPFLSIFRAF